MRRTATYSRKAKRPLEDDAAGPDPPKRPRLESGIGPLLSSSSPSSHGHIVWASSSPPAGSISPPSSPPSAAPNPSGEGPKPAQPISAPARRKLRINRRVITSTARPPLEEITDANVARPQARKNPAARLTQLQIDLGGDVRKTCAGCGMEYIPSIAEDAALHKAFHGRNTQGFHLGGLSRHGAAGRKRTDRCEDRLLDGQGDAAGRILIVHRRSSGTEKAQAKRALDMVNRELAAAEIDDASLWDQVPVLNRAESKVLSTGHGISPSSPSRAPSTSKADRFKIYLCLKGDRCVGLCLAERISQAYQVVGDETSAGHAKEAASSSSSVSVEEIGRPAILGISRIWTSGAHRRQRIASRLLETARRTFIYGMTVAKDSMAFSQPSESGKHLAESWFEAAAGWKVYREHG